MKLESLVSDDMIAAAIDFVGQETGTWISEATARHSVSPNMISSFNLKIDWLFMARAFLSGAIYQYFFGGSKIMGATFIACVAHINENLEIGDSVIGSVQSVAEACGYDRNHPNAKGPFTCLARSFMAGAKWTTKS